MDTNYTIDKEGGVYSNRSEKFLSPCIRSGYKYVSFSKNGKITAHSIHRLVAKTFIDNPENKPQVNHKDGNKYNNHVDNLEWVTCSENAKHAILNGLTPPPPTREGQFGYDHNRSIEVHEYDDEMIYLQSYGSQAEAAKHNNCNRSTINKAIINRNKTRNGKYYSKTRVEIYKP